MRPMPPNLTMMGKKRKAMPIKRVNRKMRAMPPNLMTMIPLDMLQSRIKKATRI